MRNKTESKIIEVLEKNNGEVEALTIARKIGLSYDTTSKYLKRMAEEGIIERRTKTREQYRESGRTIHPWEYYYKLNKNYQQK